MSENMLPNSENPDFNTESSSRISAGVMLRKAREAEGIQLESLAVLLKVPVHKLEALETDRFDLLLDIVFVRALAASVCRTLKIDPIPILDRLPHTVAPPLKSYASGINAPFRSPKNVSGASFFNQLSKPVMWAIWVLLIGVVVLVLYPFTPRATVSGSAQPASSTTIAPLIVPTVTDSPLVVETATAAIAPVEVVNLSAATPLPAVVASAPAVVAAPGAVTGLVVFKAHGPSWVQVIDATGVVQIRKTMADNEVAAASGTLPLAVIVGRVDTMAVQVRGMPFDLTPVTKNNTARFEVK